MTRHTFISLINACVTCLIMSFSYAHAEGEEPKRVAVLQLSNRLKMTPSEIEYLTGIVRLEAAKSLPQDYLVMTQENIVSLLPPDKTLEDCQSECEVDMGRLLGARYIITGEVLRFGSSLRLTLRLHDTQTGRLISSEIAKGKEIEDLEDPTSVAIRSLLGDLNPRQKGVRGRAERALSELEDPSSRDADRRRALAREEAQRKARAREEAQRKARAREETERKARAREEAQKKARAREEAQKRAQERASSVKETKPPAEYEHPQLEFQVGYSSTQCSPNGDLSCSGYDSEGGVPAINDFGVQYKLAQLSKISFGTDLRYTSNSLSSLGYAYDDVEHTISTISVGLAATYVTRPWFARMQLGLGLQAGETTIGEELTVTYEGGAVRFGAEAGMLLGVFSLSFYFQNESITEKVDLCPSDTGECMSGWAPGVQQVGFRMGLLL